MDGIQKETEVTGSKSKEGGEKKEKKFQDESDGEREREREINR